MNVLIKIASIVAAAGAFAIPAIASADPHDGRGGGGYRGGYGHEQRGGAERHWVAPRYEDRRWVAPRVYGGPQYYNPQPIYTPRVYVAPRVYAPRPMYVAPRVYAPRAQAWGHRGWTGRR